jgi:hypothetical protein
MRRCLLIVALFGMVFSFGLAANAAAQDLACPAPAAFMAANTQTAPVLPEALFAPVAPQNVQQCTMCNLTGYQSCDSLDQQSCGVEGSNRRCYLLPACYCEWSICRCQSGLWHCYY